MYECTSVVIRDFYAHFKDFFLKKKQTKISKTYKRIFTMFITSITTSTSKKNHVRRPNKAIKRKKKI